VVVEDMAADRITHLDAHLILAALDDGL